LTSEIRTNHELRIKAFDALNELKHGAIPRKEIIEDIHGEFGIPRGTLYDWYSDKHCPFGRRGKLIYKPELLYVLGALLGDGCLYNWKITNHFIILVGDENFTTKYATMLSPCIETKVKPYIIRSKNIWFVRTNSYRLYELFKKARENMDYLEQLIRQNKQAPLLFIEGFFDAEGCVKIIKEKVRKTPKICLDITNTNKNYLDLVQKLLMEFLGIEARYSIQKPDGKKNKKVAYHLRIYKKEYVRRFFQNIQTTKLTPEKAILLKNWLENGKG